MKLKQKSSKFILVLIVVTTIIWGVVIYKLVDYFNFNNDEDNEVITEVEPVNPKRINKDFKNELDIIKFIELERDPFTFGSKQTVTNLERTTPPPQQHLPPTVNEPKINYAINGVIINGESKLVIFEDLTNSKTLFLKEGEVYNDITIKEIGKKKVSIVEFDGIKDISLQ
jgi:hypothetical protein